MSTSIIDGFAGWGVGYNYIKEKNEEDEVKQGKNYYIAFPFQAAQTARVAQLFSKINESLPKSLLTTPINILCNIVPILALPACFFLAAAKHGQYEDFAQRLNDSKSLPFKIPTNLSKETLQKMTYVTEHFGDIMRVAMIASSIAIMAMGSYFYGGAVLAALAYESAYKMGYVSQKVSLFMERYMPTIANIGLLISGMIVVRVFALYSLLTQTSDRFNHWVQYKVEAFAHRYFKLEGVTLQELIQTPVKENRNLTFNEINTILDADDGDYEINPFHCSKSALDLSKIREDLDLDKLVSYFDEIDWSSKYSLIYTKVTKDDRFIDFLSVECQEPDKEKIKDKQQLPSFIKQLADKQNLSPKAWLLKWHREQMVGLVDILKDRRPVEGKKEHLRQGKELCSKILPYLTQIRTQKEKRMEFEDILLQLSVEAGTYCALGIKNTSSDVFETVVHNLTLNTNLTPTEQYELEIRQQLQLQRYETVKTMYARFFDEKNPLFTNHPFKPLLKSIFGDVHSFNDVYPHMALGFVPLPNETRRRLGVLDLPIWEFIELTFRDLFYKEYQQKMDEAFVKKGEAYFTNYIEKIIADFPNLSEEEKQAIKFKCVGASEAKWNFKEAPHRAHRLMFVMLGILREKKDKHAIPPQQIRREGWEQALFGLRQDTHFHYNNQPQFQH